MAYDFSNKVVLITGSSSGIGEAAAIAFAKAGAKVVVTGRDADRVAKAAQKCNEASPGKIKALEVVGDVADEEFARKLIDQTIETFNQLNVLINNAGIVTRAEITDATVLQKFDDVFRVNVRPLIWLTHLAAPHLIKAKGNVINVSSVASTCPGVGSIPYSTSKAAVDMITQCCAVELGPKGVRVNAVNPALIETPIFQHSGASADQIDSIVKFSQICYPMKRHGNIDDTTAGILFLASDQASFYTGVKLPIDGGYLAMTPNSFNTQLQASKQQ